LALARGLPVFQPERLRQPDVAATLHQWQPDLGVVAAYGKLIPDALLEIPRFGMINVHGSLLPRLRGAAPVHRAILNGDTETGITIMRVVTALDSGDMFAKAACTIDPDVTSDVLERKLAEIGAPVLVEVVDQIAGGTSVETPQDSELATYAAKITRDDGPIDWTRTALDIHNQVRGLYPWPHAHTTLQGERVIVLRSRVASNAPAPAPPGSVIETTPDSIHVATGSGTVAILELQIPGRRAMTARDFLAGHPLPAGTTLGI
jgi:methionyl-tRNA formyltransferase